MELELTAHEAEAAQITSDRMKKYFGMKAIAANTSSDCMRSGPEFDAEKVPR